MDSMILAYTLAAAFVVSAGVVLLFSKSIDEAISRVIPEEMAPAWCRYAKFALFTAAFATGQLAQFVKLRTPGNLFAGAAGQGPLDQSLLELLKAIAKTITGSLIAASGALLIIFGTALAVYASMRASQSRRAAAEKAAVPPPRAAERQPVVGSERHSGAKDRQRPEDSGRVL